MNSKDVVKMIENYGNEINHRVIMDLIDEHRPVRDRMIRDYNEYAGNVPINSRVFDNPNKLNNKLNNDFRGEIIDGITGYMFGKPITWKIDDTTYSEGDKKRIEKAIKDFRKRNNVEDLDSITGEFASICGYAARLCWIDGEGLERIMNLHPWEVIFVEDVTIQDVVYALIYYTVTEKTGNTTRERTVVEWYDKTNVTYFVTDNNGKFVPDNSGLFGKSGPHLFDFVPVIRFNNNNLQSSDFEKVRSLIDAYDRLMSDVQNEIEEFRLAYLLIFGAEITPETLQLLRQTGALGLAEGEDARFLTKQADANFIDLHKKTLSENIYKFSKSVDMSDEQFSGASQSGESRKWKLLGLEFRAITKERKFKAGLDQMMRVICSAWQKKQVPLQYEDIEFVFTRSLPVDMLYLGDVVQKLKGIVSDETLLGMLPFITDVLRELELIEQERYQYGTGMLSKVPVETNTDQEAA
ncbi:MAG: phage portal protein [Ignavibacteria bacterium]|nr:phage portal protein [Ignavibacteria bacterium]